MSQSRAGTSQRWRTGTLKLGTQYKTDSGGVSMVLSYSLLVLKKASGAATAVSLPASPLAGDIAIIKDGNGDAATYNITITDPASYTIDGSSSLVIALNYGRVILVFNGVEWNIIHSLIGAAAFGALTAASLVTTGVVTAGGVLTGAGLVNSGTNKVSVGGSTAAAGANSSNAGTLPAGTAEVYPTTAADDTKGVRMSSSDNVTGRKIYVGNGVSNKILKVYPPTGGTINGASADAAFSSVSGKGVIVVCLDSTANTGAGSFLAW